MNEDPVVSASGLARRFGRVVALAGIDLAVRRGELFGLVGPDGAGKTTLLRVLAGILPPSAGDARVAGCSVSRDPEGVKERIGYMSQRFGLYHDLTVLENILFYADLYEVARPELPARIARLLSFSSLAPFERRLAGRLSGGMKQKLGLACALVHTPEVLLLDEPTNGVDPVSRREFWKILYGLLKEGTTILVSTAYLDEAERCTRVALMHRGGILAQDTPAAIRAGLGMPMMEIATSSGRAALAAVRGMDGIREVNLYGDRLHVAADRAESLDAACTGLKAAGVDVRSCREIAPSIEDVFIAMVRAPAGAEEGGGP